MLASLFNVFWACLSTVLALGGGFQEIKKLPGVDWKLNFKHYNGYFQVSDTHHLHYWFVESQNSPQNDPLIFWFNGGPGCSSIDGLLKEMGPFLVSDDGKKLTKNKYSWNKMASVVYIESPAGVGYSYATDGNTTFNDDMSSLENYEAVKKFFQTFPEYRNHSTYIMGASYGGVYAPTLTARIVDGQNDFPINLKGMALENGYVSEAINLRTQVRFTYEHGMLSENTWNTLESECCNGCVDSCDFTQFNGQCSTIVTDVADFIWNGGVNPYDIYRECEKAVGDYPCIDNSPIITYMNRPVIRKALNIPTNLGKWDICNPNVTNNYVWQYTDMAPFFKKIVNANVRVLLYYGDTDMGCNFMMGQKFAENLGYNRTLNKIPWKIEGDRQIAGFKTLYDGLTFITVKGGGHMPPMWRRPQMFYAMKQFLMNQPI